MSHELYLHGPLVASPVTMEYNAGTPQYATGTVPTLQPQGPSPQPHLPPQAGYSPYAPQLGAAQQYMPQTGPQMAMAYLPSMAGQAPAGFDATGKPLYAVIGAGPLGPAGAGGGYAPVQGFADAQRTAAVSAMAGATQAEEQAKLMQLHQGVAMQQALHQSQATENARLAYERQMRDLAAAQQRVAYNQQEVLANSVQAPPKVGDMALPCFAVPGTASAATALGAPAYGGAGGCPPAAGGYPAAPAAPGGDPLSLIPAYGGQAPYGRTPDGRSLYKTLPGPGF